MSSLPTYSFIELAQLERSESSPSSMASIASVDLASPAIPYFPSSANANANANANPYGWLPSPHTPSGLPFQTSYPVGPTGAPVGLGFTLSPSQYPSSFGFNYVQQSLLQAHQIPSSFSTSTCAAPLDVFGTTSPLLFDSNESQSHSAPPTNLASPCSSVEDLVAFRDKATSVSSSAVEQLKKEKKPSAQPKSISMTSKTAPIPLAGDGFDEDGAIDQPAEGPRKRSRTAQACERCRVRKARCFGGNPCNRCIKRKFVCEFTPTRQRGPNKPRSPELSSSKPKVRRHSVHAVSATGTGAAKSHAHSHSHSQTHAQAQTHTHAHAHASSHTHTHTQVSLNLDAPINSLPPMSGLSLAPSVGLGIGLGLEFTPPAEDDAEGESDPDPEIDLDIPLPPLALSSRSTGTASQSGWSSMLGGNELYTPFAEEDIFRFSPALDSESSTDSNSNGNGNGSGSGSGMYDYPYTPMSPNMGLPFHGSSSSNSSSALFAMSQDLQDVRDSALRHLYGSSVGGEWYGASSVGYN